MRSIVFTSYNADICTALNWKQPNYPVLLCNDLGTHQESVTDTAENVSRAVIGSDGYHSMSVKEAVRIAQSNNFMGLVCRSSLLRMVPSLVNSIKTAGLVLVTDNSADRQQQHGAESAPPGAELRMLEGVDGVLRGNGVLRFHETIDM